MKKFNIEEMMKMAQSKEHKIHCHMTELYQQYQADYDDKLEEFAEFGKQFVDVQRKYVTFQDELNILASRLKDLQDLLDEEDDE